MKTNSCNHANIYHNNLHKDKNLSINNEYGGRRNADQPEEKCHKGGCHSEKDNSKINASNFINSRGGLDRERNCIVLDKDIFNNKETIKEAFEKERDKLRKSQNHSRDNSKDSTQNHQSMHQERVKFLQKGVKKSRRSTKSHYYESVNLNNSSKQKPQKVLYKRSMTGGPKKNKNGNLNDRSNSVTKDNVVNSNISNNMTNTSNTNMIMNTNKINRKYQNFTEELVHMLNLKINKRKLKVKS